MFYVTRKYRNVITGFSIWNIRHIIPCNVIGWESLSCILLASHAWLGPGQSSSLAVNHQGFMKCVSLPFVHPLLAAHNMQVSYQQVQLGMVPGQEATLPACHRLHRPKLCCSLCKIHYLQKEFYFIYYFLWWSLYFIKIQRNVVFPWHSATATLSNSEWANKNVITEHECKHADVRLW